MYLTSQNSQKSKERQFESPPDDARGFKRVKPALPESQLKYHETTTSSSLMAMENTLDRYQLASGVDPRTMKLFHFTKIEMFRLAVERAMVRFDVERSMVGKCQVEAGLDTYLDDVMLRYVEDHSEDMVSRNSAFTSRESGDVCSSCQFSPIKPHCNKPSHRSQGLTAAKSPVRVDLMRELLDIEDAMIESPPRMQDDNEVESILFANPWQF